MVKVDARRLTCTIAAIFIVIAPAPRGFFKISPSETVGSASSDPDEPTGNPLALNVLERPTPPSRGGPTGAGYEFPDEGNRDGSVHLNPPAGRHPAPKPKGNLAKSSRAFFYVRQEDNNATSPGGGEESPRRMTCISLTVTITDTCVLRAALQHT